MVMVLKRVTLVHEGGEGIRRCRRGVGGLETEMATMTPNLKKGLFQDVLPGVVGNV